MFSYQNVLLIIGVIILVKGALLIANPKWIHKMLVDLAKDKKLTRTFGFIALIIGAIIVFYTL